MNSSFRNSNLGFVLYAAIITIIVAVLAIITWYMLVGYRSGTYSEGTIIGSVYLGGLREEDVDAKVNQRVDIWLDDPTIVFELTYQGYSYEFDRTLFDFDVQLSKDLLVDGQHNELIAKYQTSGDDRERTHQEIYNLPFLDGVNDNVDIEKLINDVLDDAGLMKTFSSKAVEDYIINPEQVVMDLNSVTLELPEGMSAMDLIEGVEDVYGDEFIDLESKELFDIVDMLGEELLDTEMTVLSVALLELSHETNFNIHEVHYKSKYTSNGYTYETFNFGSNSFVDQNIDSSFSLYNPNNSVYSFRLEEGQNDTLVVTLVGLEFVNTIEVEIIKTEIPFVTEYQDDGPFSDGQIGVVVSVQRTITDLSEEVLFNKEIIFEFYQPVTEIKQTQVPE